MRRNRSVKKLQLNKDTLANLTQQDLAWVNGGAETRAFSDCRFCSVGGGTSCVSDSNCTDPRVCGPFPI
ncbi:MAG: class I lanthipeptide [Acidobacteria bacterium]|nr:class I lanthipeptide [Acidobacteriota bacterium]